MSGGGTFLGVSGGPGSAVTLTADDGHQHHLPVAALPALLAEQDVTLVAADTAELARTAFAAWAGQPLCAAVATNRVICLATTARLLRDAAGPGDVTPPARWEAAAQAELPARGRPGWELLRERATGTTAGFGPFGVGAAVRGRVTTRTIGEVEGERLNFPAKLVPNVAAEIGRGARIVFPSNWRPRAWYPLPPVGRAAGPATVVLNETGGTLGGLFPSALPERVVPELLRRYPTFRAVVAARNNRELARWRDLLGAAGLTQLVYRHDEFWPTRP